MLFQKSKMAVAAILTKWEIATAYLSRSVIDFNEISERDAVRFSWAFGP